MSQKILLRRGTELERLAIATPPLLGEVLHTTDRKEIFVGDGVADFGNALNYIKANGYGVDQSITGNLGITGNLTVTGNVTTTTSNDVVIGDSIMILNAQSADVPVNDAGFEVERGLQTNTSILWKEGTDDWRLTDTAGERRILDTDDLGTGYTSGTGISIITGVIANTDTGSAQNIFKTITGDTGSTTANTNTDTLNIVGAGGVSTAVVGDTLTITSAAVSNASTTTKGIVELATLTETNTGTDSTRAVTPASLATMQSDIATALALDTNVPTELSIGTKTSTTLGITSDGSADDVILPAASSTEAGLLSAAKFDEIVANSLKVSNIPTSLSAGTITGTSYGITSDGGSNDIILPTANATEAGLLSAALYNNIIANNAKNTNVPTQLTNGTITSTTYGITSDGSADDVILASASGTKAGLLTAALYNNIIANNAKNTNVPTSLSVGTRNSTTTAITSDGGADDVILPAATTSLSGLMTAADKVKVDGAVQDVVAAAGLTESETSGNITLAIGQNADNSIIVNANDIQVGTIDGGSF